MTTTVRLPDLHPGQREVWAHPARFQVLACGRRWGKTRLGALRCVAEALQGGRAWWVAPSYPMSTVGWRLLTRLSKQVPGTAIKESERIITLPGGGTVQVKSANKPDSLRGEGLDYLVMDECAFIQETAWTEALRPALADRQGEAMMISTPKGRNWFWRAWMRGGGESSHPLAQDVPDEWQSWQLPTANNPYILASEIEAARGGLPERVFRQEFLAEFIDDAGGVFRRVMDAATAVEQERAVEGHQYLIGVDWGKQNDWTVLAVVDVTDNALVAIDRFNRIDYAVQVGRLKAMFERFQPQRIIAEANSMGEPIIEQLYREDLPVQPFTTTNATKAAIVEALALAFERSTIQIVADQALVNELQGFEMERLPSGLMRYQAPAGMHDDCVMALALAWSGVGQGTGIWV